jgi:hypothetical protein
MLNALKRKYYIVVTPAILVAIALIIFKRYDILQINPTPFILNTLAPLVFILTALLALAAPIYYRAIFNRKIKDYKSLTPEKFYSYERNTIYFITLTPYLVLTAYILQLPQFFFGGTVLFSLYALYFYYPSERRFDNEQRIYRIKEKTDSVASSAKNKQN